MLTEERFTRILSILESMGSVTVQQLMTELDASESTIRRDLNTLDANGQLIKVHGGAILKNTSYSTEDDEVMQRKERNKGAKEKIAKYASGLIEPGDFVYIDAGTTTDLMIDFITTKQAVFVTNAITHAKKLARKGCTVYILGGEFKAITEAIVGEEAVSYDSLYIFDLIYTNRCFFTLLSVIHTIINALLPLLKTFDRIFYIIRKNFNHLCIFRLIPYDTHFLKCLSGNITPQCHQYATVRYDQHIFRLPF